MGDLTRPGVIWIYRRLTRPQGPQHLGDLPSCPGKKCGHGTYGTHRKKRGFKKQKLRKFTVEFTNKTWTCGFVMTSANSNEISGEFHRSLDGAFPTHRGGKARSFQPAVPRRVLEHLTLKVNGVRQPFLEVYIWSAKNGADTPTL